MRTERGQAAVPLTYWDFIHKRDFMIDYTGAAHISIKETEFVTVLTRQRLWNSCFLGDRSGYFSSSRPGMVETDSALEINRLVGRLPSPYDSGSSSTVLSA